MVLRHGINASQLRRWIKVEREPERVGQEVALLPVTVRVLPATPARAIAASPPSRADTLKWQSWTCGSSFTVWSVGCLHNFAQRINSSDLKKQNYVGLDGSCSTAMSGEPLYAG